MKKGKADHPVGNLYTYLVGVSTTVYLDRIRWLFLQCSWGTTILQAKEQRVQWVTILFKRNKTNSSGA